MVCCASPNVYSFSVANACCTVYSFCMLSCLVAHRKKRFTSFPSPSGMSLIKLPLGRNNSVMTSLFPPRKSFVVTSRLGTGNSRTFFYSAGAITLLAERRNNWHSLAQGLMLKINSKDHRGNVRRWVNSQQNMGAFPGKKDTAKSYAENMWKRRCNNSV
jgi:hypothetical protein